jgi:adenosine deaminase
VGLIIASNRTKHPLEARTLARLAGQYADSGVIGFGLSNDERRGEVRDFEGAFKIARNKGLLAVPHAGETRGSESVKDAVRLLGANRVGHGVRAIEDPYVLDLLVENNVTCEVCPDSNVALGVAEHHMEVPIRELLARGVSVALGADDPLLFGGRLARQYRIARHEHGLSDESLAHLARCSILASAAPGVLKAQMLEDIASWLNEPPRQATIQKDSTMKVLV